MQIHGVELKEQGDMVIHHQRRSGRSFEYQSVQAWRKYAKNTVIDVGAYTGLFSLIAAQEGANVIAFEPNAAVRARFRENILTNRYEDDIQVLAMAASDKAGEAAMEVNAKVPLTSGGKLVSGKGIQLITIDSLGLDDVSAIKIDVEGHELTVILGAEKTITQCRPLLITEYLTINALHRQRSLLLPLGYSYELADERNAIWRV